MIPQFSALWFLPAVLSFAPLSDSVLAKEGKEETAIHAQFESSASSEAEREAVSISEQASEPALAPALAVEAPPSELTSAAPNPELAVAISSPAVASARSQPELVEERPKEAKKLKQRVKGVRSSAPSRSERNEDKPKGAGKLKKVKEAERAPSRGSKSTGKASSAAEPEWTVSYVNKRVEKDGERLSDVARERLDELVGSMQVLGPIQTGHNFSLLKDGFHRHLTDGRECTVACWRADKENRQIQIYYVGSHGQAPYSRGK